MPYTYTLKSLDTHLHYYFFEISFNNFDCLCYMHKCLLLSCISNLSFPFANFQFNPPINNHVYTIAYTFYIYFCYGFQLYKKFFAKTKYNYNIAVFHILLTILSFSQFPFAHKLFTRAYVHFW